MQTTIRSQRTGRAVRTVTVEVNPATGKRYLKAELAALIAGSTTSLYFRQLLKDTLGELQERYNRKANYRHPQRVATGSVHRHDGQADIYGGRYKVVGFDAVTGTYTAEVLPPDDQTIESIIADVISGAYYAAPGEDKAEAAEAEIQRRTARAGETFQIKFVSAATYAEMF